MFSPNLSFFHQEFLTFLAQWSSMHINAVLTLYCNVIIPLTYKIVCVCFNLKTNKRFIIIIIINWGTVALFAFLKIEQHFTSKEKV